MVPTANAPSTARGDLAGHYSRLVHYFGDSIGGRDRPATKLPINLNRLLTAAWKGRFQTCGMSLSATDLKELEAALADRLFIQINGWHLYLGDADLAGALAIECSARCDQSPALIARQAIEAVKVNVAGGASQLPLSRLLPPGQLSDLEDILEPYCG